MDESLSDQFYPRLPSALDSFRGTLLVENFVENRTRTYHHSWQTAGQTYQMDGVLIKLALKNNRVVDLDSYWLAEGNILLNSAPHARLSLGRDGLGYLTVQLEHPNGVEILETYQP